MHDIVDLSPGAVGLVWEGMGGEGANVLGTLLHARHRVRSSCASSPFTPRINRGTHIAPMCQDRGREGTVQLDAADS